MKNISTLLIFCFLCSQSIFAQSQKIFVKSLTADANSVVVDLEGQATVSEWNEKFVRVTTTVEVTNFNEEILKRLVAVGRYALTSTTENGSMQISMPKLTTKLTIKGQTLNEVMSYEILVPAGTTVEVVNSETTTASDVN